MDVVLALHAHIPYVLHHGRWPHGSTWLAEAAVDSYLPLADSLCALRDEHIPAHFTVGFTPVLAAQLASPALACELEAFLGERIAACDDAPARMIGADRDALLPVAAYWRARWAHALKRLRALDGDLLAPFRALEADGRVELMTSAATHALLPLLARDESIHLQLDAGKREHARHFGHRPTGCWLPECGYRPAGEWDPLPAARRKVNRAGLEDHVAAAGFRYFFVGAHVARAGAPPDDYAVPHAFTEARAVRSPYRTYRVSTSPPLHDVHVLPRDPETAMLVWSRNDGYPGTAITWSITSGTNGTGCDAGASRSARRHSTRSSHTIPRRRGARRIAMHATSHIDSRSSRPLTPPLRAAWSRHHSTPSCSDTGGTRAPTGLPRLPGPPPPRQHVPCA
jgi:1,4-alpha-glucan branching enzyme